MKSFLDGSMSYAQGSYFSISPTLFEKTPKDSTFFQTVECKLYDDHEGRAMGSAFDNTNGYCIDVPSVNSLIASWQITNRSFGIEGSTKLMFRTMFITLTEDVGFVMLVPTVGIRQRLVKSKD